VEAMQNGIPVLCTDISGISEVVKYCGMGEVVAPTCEELSQAVDRLLNQYEVYISTTNRKRLDEKIDNSNLVDIIEKFAEENIPAKPVTLYEWDRRLKTVGKYLVKGHQKMKEYYQQQQVADKYTETRFTSKALKCFDYIERQNLELMIEDRYQNYPNMKILDIACGDGRISQECIKYGNTTSIDSSQAMLNIVDDRFKDLENKPTTQLCDIISEDVEGRYNVITCFRYIRHFEYATRKLLYKKILSHLTDSGLFIMDVPNLKFELQLKDISGWEKYNIYDVFWTKESIVEELEKNGFKVFYIMPVGQGLMSNLPDSAKSIPMSWTIGACKKY
jgi:2-polyprenyl-3-methyl-5-hydroxy-6-metoxy-1,4-benzoquinol methylase